ncbi:hypothetical protein HPB47_024042, partial [Ixodes persulcatus]
PHRRQGLSLYATDVITGGHTGGRSDPGTVHKRERRPSVRVGPNRRKRGGGSAKWGTCACPLPDREGVRVGQAHCLLGSGESSPYGAPLPSKRCVGSVKADTCIPPRCLPPWLG